jgi:hypothetical protein
VRSRSSQLGPEGRKSVVAVLLDGGVVRAEVVPDLDLVALAQRTGVIDSGMRCKDGYADVGAGFVRPLFLQRETQALVMK